MAEPPGIRIGDVERHQVVDVLRRAASDGHLTLDEFAERTGDVFAARTREDLDRVLVDLPAGMRPPAPAPAPSPAPAAPAAEPGDARRSARRRFVAIMGGSRPRGRWRAAERITAFAFWGGVTVDLRRALIGSPTLEITAWAIMGGVQVVVPDGIPVELDGYVLMGGTYDRARPVQQIAGAPLVRVRARGLWGGVAVRNGRNRNAPRALTGSDSTVDEVSRSGIDRSHDEAPSDSGSGDAGRRSGPNGPPGLAPPGLPAGSLDDLLPSVPAPRRSQASRSAEPAEPARPVRATPGPLPEAAGGAGTLTVLVTDICRSTEFAARLGDQRWLGVLHAHNALVREQIHRHQGREVKAQGDGFLVTFTSARRAVLAGVDIQRALAEYRRAHPEHVIELRIGLHTGEVMEDRGDVLGQNVVVAVRIADVAEPGEILVSRLTKELTDAGGDLGFDGGREVALKGVAGTWRVHAVSWR